MRAMLIAKRGAFSLAEMMIALVILGLGLLFIAAALPAGLEYSRATVDASTADEAAQHAMEVVVQNLRTSKRLTAEPMGLPASVTLYQANRAPRLDNLFRPRTPADGALRVRKTPDVPLVAMADHVVPLDWEPFIKVRPLTMGNITLGRAYSGAANQRGDPIVDDGELAIAKFLNVYTGANGDIPSEYDWLPTDESGLSEFISLSTNPPLPAVARIFPPSGPEVSLLSADFFSTASTPYPPFVARPNTDSGILDSFGNPLFSGTNYQERVKATDSRIGWTVFYRRVAYTVRTKTFDTRLAAGNQEFYAYSPADPLTYEIIVVVTRRPTATHRFAAQDLGLGGGSVNFTTPSAVGPSPSFGAGSSGARIGSDRLLPTPWLITFDTGLTAREALSIPGDGSGGTSVDYDPGVYYNGTLSDRPLNPAYVPPGKVVFKITQAIDPLLPVGSVIIPAVDDDRDWTPAGIVGNPNAIPRRAGFVPHSPATLPIYEVIERPDSATVVVANNGIYPWVAPGLDAESFPCWIIPPAFNERDVNGQPVYDRKTPVVAVLRRIVRLPEVQ